MKLARPVIGHNARFSIEAWIKFSVSRPPLQIIYSEAANAYRTEEIALRIVTPNVVSIGGYNDPMDGVFRPFKGAIDEVTVHSTARSAAEILADYQRASLQICPVFTFYAATGTAYQVEATTNVADTNAWTTVATNRTVTTLP